MKCDIKNRDTIIEEYLRGNLAEAEMQSFEAHYPGCETCTLKLRLEEETIALIEEEGHILFAECLQKDKQKVCKGILEKWLAKLRDIDWSLQKQWAFALCMAAVFITLVLVLQSSNNDKSSSFIAENFYELPRYEEMINNPNYRAGYSVKVLSPSNNFNTNCKISFEWESDLNPPFYLNILDNRGKTLCSYKVEGTKYVFNVPIPAGLYYWKLESEDELLHVGKFFINKPEEKVKR